MRAVKKLALDNLLPAFIIHLELLYLFPFFRMLSRCEGERPDAAYKRIAMGVRVSD